MSCFRAKAHLIFHWCLSSNIVSNSGKGAVKVTQSIFWQGLYAKGIAGGGGGGGGGPGVPISVPPFFKQTT